MRIAYEQAPALVRWRVNSYLDLRSEQAMKLRTDLDSLQRWHRQAQLPEQLDQLRVVQKQISNDVSAQLACRTFEQFRGQALELFDRAAPIAVWLSMDLSAAQIARLEKRLSSDNAEWRAEWLDKSETQLREARFEQWLSRSERLYGSLEARQKEAIRAALAESPQDAQLDWALRQTRQQELVSALREVQREKAGIAQAQVRMRRAYELALTPADPEQREYVARMRFDGCRTFSVIHNSTTTIQRQNAARTLERYRAEFGELVIQVGLPG